MYAHSLRDHTLGSESKEVTKLGKRKRRDVSLKTKLEIIGELKTGKSQRVVASDFVIPMFIVAICN